MNLIYLKIMLKYVKKMFSVYLFMIVTISMTLVLIFTPIVVVKSQSINIREYLNKYKTNYDAIAKNVNREQLEKVGNEKNVKSYYYQKDLGTFKESNNDIKYSLKTFNENTFDMEKYTLTKGNYPNSSNEIIVGENSSLKKYFGKELSGVITKDIEENNIHEKINKKDSFRVVGVYKRDSKTQEIINKLQIACSEDVLTNINFSIPGEDRYNLYIVFNRGGKSVPSMIYAISEKILGGCDAIQSNELSEKINDSFINATDDAIRMFKPIIISGTLIIFLIYLLVFEDRIKMLETVKTLGGQKKKIVLSIIIENTIIMLTTVVIGTVIGMIISSKMVRGTDLTGFVTDLNISNKKLHVSYKDIINSSMISLISLITITLYECLYIYNKLKIFEVIGRKIELPKVLIKRNKKIKMKSSKNYTLKISSYYFKSSFKRYIIPIIVLSMFGSLSIGFYNIEKNDRQFFDKTRYDQINKYRDYGLTNNGYLGDERTILNAEFKKSTSNVMQEYNSNGYISVDTKNLNSDFKDILNLSRKNISNYELNTYFRGISDEEINNFKKQGVLENEDELVLNRDGLVLINGFYYRDMAMDIKIFNNNPNEIDLKYIRYEGNEERYKNKIIKDIIVHEYNDKFKVINPELEYPVIIIKDTLLKKLTNIHQPTNIYFDVKDNRSEKYINNMLENNQKYIVFNAKYYKEKNESVSAILYKGVKKINIFILFLFSIITMMFTVKLTIIYRENDINTLIAVGASNKKVLTIFTSEGLILGIVCSFISIFIGIKNGYINYSRFLGEQVNKSDMHFIVNYSTIIALILIILILSTVFQIIYLNKKNK